MSADTVDTERLYMQRSLLINDRNIFGHAGTWLKKGIHVVKDVFNLICKIILFLKNANTLRTSILSKQMATHRAKNLHQPSWFAIYLVFSLYQP